MLRLLLLDVSLPLLCALNGLLDLSMIVAIEHLPEVEVVGIGDIRLQVHQHVSEEENLVQGVELRVIQVMALQVIVAVVIFIIFIILIVTDQVNPVLLIFNDLTSGLSIVIDLRLLLLLVVLLADDDRLLREVHQGLHDHRQIVRD